MSTGSNPSITIYFSSVKVMYIENRSYIFHEVDINGFVSEVPVIVNPDQNLRRLQSFQEASTPKYLDRCSFDTGVCFHTYDEIVELHQESRRLNSKEDDSDQITYGEIHGNVEILSKDSRSSLSHAASLIQGLLRNNTLDYQGSITISFVMAERCANYEDLMEDCNGYPVPDPTSTTTDLADFIDNIAPFTGLVPIGDRWMFRDEIEYTIDPYSIQLKVSVFLSIFTCTHLRGR
jgi:hypothetical protein